MANKIQTAKETVIYTIEKDGVNETNLFDHVIESARETTTPKGVGKIDYVSEVYGSVYRHLDTKELINEDEYNDLDEDEQSNYEFYGEAPYKWEARKWIGNGSKSHLLTTYDNDNDALDELFERYMNDFETDDQRYTMYFDTKEEAQMEFEKTKL